MAFSWQMAEELAAAHMRELGFTDARRMPDGNDGGIDVVSSAAVAQVKYHQLPVGRPDIQKLRGASHGVDNALFYSFSGYTASAINSALTTNVALFKFDATNEVEPVNEHAVGLLSASNTDVVALSRLRDRFRMVILRWRSISPLTEELLRRAERRLKKIERSGGSQREIDQLALGVSRFTAALEGTESLATEVNRAVAALTTCLEAEDYAKLEGYLEDAELRLDRFETAYPQRLGSIRTQAAKMTVMRQLELQL